MNLWSPNISAAERRWAWATLALWVVIFQGPSFLENVRESSDVLPDFFQEWASARNRFEGLPVYTSHSVTIPRYLDDPRQPLVQVNAHPPTSVLLALPLAGLGFHTAFAAWNVASLTLFAASLWVVVRSLGVPVTAWTVFPAAVLLLTCSPLWQEIHMGQLGLVLTLLITGAWSAGRSGRPWSAGAMLGAAAAIKLFPAFLLVYYAWRREWRIVTAGVSALACLTAVTSALLGPECYRDYAVAVLPEIQWFRVGWNNASLAGFWSRLFDPELEHVRTVSCSDPLYYSPALARAATGVSCLLVAAALAGATRRLESREEEDTGFALAAVAMLLVSPITWDHYFIILVAPLAILWRRTASSPSSRASFLAAAGALWTLPAAVWSLFGIGGRAASPVESATVISYQMYALLVLYAVGTYELRTLRHRRPGHRRAARAGTTHDGSDREAGRPTDG